MTFPIQKSAQLIGLPRTSRQLYRDHHHLNSVLKTNRPYPLSSISCPNLVFASVLSKTLPCLSLDLT